MSSEVDANGYADEPETFSIIVRMDGESYSYETCLCDSCKGLHRRAIEEYLKEQGFK